MKTRLEIAGYRLVIPNGIWVREDEEFLQLPNGSMVPASRWLHFYKYVNIPKDEALDLIKEAAQKALLSKKRGSLLTREVRKSFKREYLEKIASDDCKARQYLSNHCVFFPRQVDRSYITAASSLILNPVMEEFKTATGKLNEQDYFLAIMQSRIRFWNFVLKLNQDNSLPEATRVKKFLEGRFDESDLLTIICDGELNEEFLLNLNLLYTSLDSAKKVKLLDDKTKSHRQNMAIDTVLSAAECYKKTGGRLLLCPHNREYKQFSYTPSEN